MRAWNLWNNFWIHMSTCLRLTSNKAIIILIFINHIKNFLVFHGTLGENLLFCIYCSPVWTNVTTFIFTKFMRCLVKHWRINAFRLACFLDDGLGVASSYKMTLFHSNFVKKSQQNVSFIINEEKSVRKPSQTLNWLGIRINSKKASTVYQQKNCQL